MVLVNLFYFPMGALHSSPAPGVEEERPPTATREIRVRVGECTPDTRSVLKTKYSLLLFGERPERPESDVYCVSGESQSALCVVALG